MDRNDKYQIHAKECTSEKDMLYDWERDGSQRAIIFVTSIFLLKNFNKGKEKKNACCDLYYYADNCNYMKTIT